MRWPSATDVRHLVLGPEIVPVERALAAAIDRFETATGWTPFWSLITRTEKLMANRAGYFVLRNPCKSVVSVTVDGVVLDSTGWSPVYGDHESIVAIHLTASGKEVTAQVTGGVMPAVPPDVFEAVAAEAARIAQADPRVDGLDVSVAYAVSTRRSTFTAFERVCARWRRVRV